MVFFIAGGIGFLLSALNSQIAGVAPLLVVKNTKGIKTVNYN